MHTKFKPKTLKERDRLGGVGGEWEEILKQILDKLGVRL
jgi:hypothetical protein